jgi:hypothetical protein
MDRMSNIVVKLKCNELKPPTWRAKCQSGLRYFPQDYYKRTGDSCIVVHVALLKVELNLVSPVICSIFYSSRPASYTVTQGPTGGPRVVGSLYSRALLARSSK